MLNNVTLIGRLGKDVELKYTESGLAVASGTLAVSRRFQTKNGEREVDWINFVIWRKAAETFANFTHKGSLVGLEGRIQTHNYENKQGQRVYVTEVIVENFSFLEPRSRNENNGGGNYNGGSMNNNAPQNQNQNANPYTSGNPAPAASSQGMVPNSGSNNQNSNANNNAADPFANSGDSIDISDDDLPF